MKIIRRKNESHDTLASLPPVLQNIYAARGVSTLDDISYDVNSLLPYHDLLGIQEASHYLASQIQASRRFLIIGDFDADGATASAVAVRALRMFGAEVDYLVPNRFEYGYGLTPAIVEVALTRAPHVIITVDNGMSSIEGVLEAKKHGVEVIITDHHLPGRELPNARAIINPNQTGDLFPSKAMAGVGVIFYVMLALRRALKDRGWFDTRGMAFPSMVELLDLVALGTIADVVPLDHNNRILVAQGLQRIARGQCCPGILALLQMAGRSYPRVVASDLSFGVAPRLNAAGRLKDMSLGIACLLENTFEVALPYARQLDELNKKRRAIESEMQQQALALMQDPLLGTTEGVKPATLCLYDATWHQGVIGIVAGRMKDKAHRPTIVFADSGDGVTLKGSGRSISGIHLRDVLDLVAQQEPGILTKFGGHAMAAGLTIEKIHFQAFAQAFETIVAGLLTEDHEAKIWSDGALQAPDLTLEFAQLLRASGPWGQHFSEPLFDNQFVILQQRLIGDKHLKLLLGIEQIPIALEAMAFSVDREQWPNARAQKIHAVYRLDVHEYQNRQSLQLLVEHLEAVE